MNTSTNRSVSKQKNCCSESTAKPKLLHRFKGHFNLSSWLNLYSGSLPRIFPAHIDRRTESSFIELSLVK